MRYELASVIAPERRRARRRGTLRRALRLPQGFNPRARALAAQWRARLGERRARCCARAIDFLRQGRYSTRSSRRCSARDSVDEFLFDTREGFCEHFSSAFVFLMRAAGIPARVVTGYQGGELNPVDSIITVRQSDAHAWAEVFLGQRGWVRVDPDRGRGAGARGIGPGARRAAERRRCR